MKRRLHSSLKAPGSGLKKILALMLVLVAVLGTAGYFGYNYLQKQKTTLNYSLKQLEEALAKNDLERLEQLINFRSVAHGVAPYVLAQQQTLKAGESQKPLEPQALQELEDTIVAALQERIMAKEAGAKPKQGGKDAVFSISRDTLTIIPPDLAAQLLAGKFLVIAQDGNTAIVGATLRHGQLNRDFAIKLSLQFVENHWTVTSLANAPALIDEFMQAVEQLKQIEFDAFTKTNNAVKEKLDQHYHVNECAITFFPASQGENTRLRVTLRGENAGQDTVINSSISITINGAAGKKAAALRLENAQRINIGERFEHSWLLNNNGDKPEIDRLFLMKDTFTCVARASSAVLGNAKMLFPRVWRPKYTMEP